MESIVKGVGIWKCAWGGRRGGGRGGRAALATVKRLGGSAAGEVWQPEISGGRKKWEREKKISLPAPHQNDYVKSSLFIEGLRWRRGWETKSKEGGAVKKKKSVLSLPPGLSLPEDFLTEPGAKMSHSVRLGLSKVCAERGNNQKGKTCQCWIPPLHWPPCAIKAKAQKKKSKVKEKSLPCGSPSY